VAPRTFPPEGQAFLGVHPIKALFSDLPAFPEEQDPQPAVPETDPGLRELTDSPHDPVFRAINKAGRVWGDGMSPKVLLGARLDPDDGTLPWMQTATARCGQRPSRNRAGRRLS
jgi:hypothetical protein